MFAKKVSISAVLAVFATFAILPGFAETPSPASSTAASPTSQPSPSESANSTSVSQPPRKVAKYDIRLPFFQQSKFSATFSEHSFSYKAADSIWVLVNKARPLNPVTYAPRVVRPRFAKNGLSNPLNQKLRSDAASAIATFDATMFSTIGMRLTLNSAYRSYESQKAVHAGMVKRWGSTKGEHIAAREGFSEHQTGLAVDISPVAVSCSKCTKASGYRWMAQNSWKFGFILRYPDKKAKVTGYQYEPWHFRYVGTLLAEEYYYLGAKTLEEFLGAGAAPGYDVSFTDAEYFY